MNGGAGDSVRRLYTARTHQRAKAPRAAPAHAATPKCSASRCSKSTAQATYRSSTPLSATHFSRQKMDTPATVRALATCAARNKGTTQARGGKDHALPSNTTAPMRVARCERKHAVPQGASQNSPHSPCTPFPCHPPTPHPPPAVSLPHDWVGGRPRTCVIVQGARGHEVRPELLPGQAVVVVGLDALKYGEAGGAAATSGLRPPHEVV